MKYSSIISLFCVSSLAAAQIWGAPGGGGWGWGPGWAGPDCASSCISSAFQPEPTAWASHCATGSALSSCVNAACPSSVATASIWSFQSSVCSSWSSACTSSACSDWPAGWGGWGGPGSWGAWGTPNGNGWYTVTATETGLSTRTVVVTTTVSGTVLETATITQTATLVAAGAAVTNNAPATTSTGAACRQDISNSVVALVAAAVGAMAVA
ncbi:hypothetical protein OIDMADRAFT_59060 [Oidiodendron maius Zn]|uniref:Extracellular membrane protein CFEM domain-containing protein n=1 Tax=Oidiodendron maius (strain Zn) TaxID=913774 RepID=A0A0C3D234_OIDMZ|nr:hypothetical protein OIDMADRAFT_59060 [Oidiodendron maius Zn]